MTDPGIKPWPRVRTSRVDLVLWPYEPGSKADEQSREQAERHHGAGLDEVQVGAADAERRSLGVGLGPDARLGVAERCYGVLLLGLKFPAALSTAGAFG